MLRFICKIFFLSLCYLSLCSISSCSKNKNTQEASISSIVFTNDFETEIYNPIWKKVVRVEDTSACSGNYVCECAEKNRYAFGFNMSVDDSVGNRNALMSFDMMLRSEAKPDATFVISIQRDGESLLWMSFPLSNGFITENEWYNCTFEINVPNDVLRNSMLKCYVLNNNKNHFFIDDFNFTILLFDVESYLDEVEKYDIPKNLKNIFDTKSVGVLYSERENQIVLADDEDNILTYPLSLYNKLIIDSDTVVIQTSEFQKIMDLDNRTMRLMSHCSQFDAQLTVSYKENNPNVDFDLETVFDDDVKVLRSSLIIPFVNDDFTVYRRNPFVDTNDYQNVYYLDQEGFSLNVDEKQLNLYHPDNVSSLQLDVENKTAYINTDFYYDHFLIRFELLDTADYYIDNSSTFVKKGSSINSSFVISLTDRASLPRVMPVMDGYEAAFIWTEHADWTDIKTHRATYFGSEEIIDIENATGGFAYYDIPVTKSVFYNNPDSINNFDKNSDFPGLHSTIMTDSSYFDFLKQLDDNGFDICLHTPEQNTSNRKNLSEALSFMKDCFASSSWIDHGYNNGIMSNREDMVCDGLDSTSPYYVYDLWKENGVKFPWNASLEDEHLFDNYLFYNDLLRPYPGFGDAIPLPHVSRHPMYPDILMWSTPCTVEPGPNWAWNYYFKQDIINKIVDYRYVYITHIYAPWVTEERGFWEMKDEKLVAKEGFNQALEKIADLRDKHLLLPTTIADYMTYQQQLRQLEYRVNDDGSVVLKNNNNETIKGLSLISVKEMSLDDGKSFEQRKTQSGDEWIIWFDINPNEVVKVFNVNNN